MVPNRNSGWLERTCRILAAVQEAVLQAALEIRCKPHLHPYIHSTEFISTAESSEGRGGGVKGTGWGWERGIYCSVGYLFKKRERDMIPLAQRK